MSHVTSLKCHQTVMSICFARRLFSPLPIRPETLLDCPVGDLPLMLVVHTTVAIVTHPSKVREHVTDKCFYPALKYSVVNNIGFAPDVGP